MGVGDTYTVGDVGRFCSDSVSPAAGSGVPVGAGVAVGMSVGVIFSRVPPPSYGAKVLDRAGCADGLSQPEISTVIRANKSLARGSLVDFMGKRVISWMCLTGGAAKPTFAGIYK